MHAPIPEIEEISWGWRLPVLPWRHRE